MGQAYVDAGAGMARIGEVAAWSFDLESWGECAQAHDEPSALTKLAARLGREVRVAERIEPGDRAQVFAADRLPATDAQVERTAVILSEQRSRTLELLRSASKRQLTANDARVEQPGWMAWRTPEAIGWHIAETESRHYLSLLGLARRPREEDLLEELRASGEWIQTQFRTMPRDAVAEVNGEVWTTTKVLRRLAWHERVEAVFLRRRLTGRI